MHESRDIVEQIGNMTKGEVDTADKYPISTIARTWTLSLFYMFLNIAGINSEPIFKSNCKNHDMNRREFLRIYWIY